MWTQLELGQGVDKQGYITDDAIERNIKALVEFSNICKEESCEKVYCRVLQHLEIVKIKMYSLN